MGKKLDIMIAAKKGSNNVAGKIFWAGMIVCNLP
jgi:hypothetical protein